MKRINIYISLLLSMIFLISCEKTDISVNYKPHPSPYKVFVLGEEVTPNKIKTFEFTKDATHFDINVEAYENAWWINLSDNSWVGFDNQLKSKDIYRTGGTAEEPKTITIFIGENKTGKERIENITIKMSFNLPPVTFAIKQH